MNAYQKETELTDQEFITVLDDIYGDVTICGMKYSSGRALLKLNEPAFNCARNDYTDGLDKDSPVYICDECDDEFDNEDDAEECCKPEENEE